MANEIMLYLMHNACTSHTHLYFANADGLFIEGVYSSLFRHIHYQNSTEE